MSRSPLPGIPCTSPGTPSGVPGLVHRRNTNPSSITATGISITPMEKYVDENAKLVVVAVLPLMSILLVDPWVPSAGDMLVLRSAC